MEIENHLVAIMVKNLFIYEYLDMLKQCWSSSSWEDAVDDANDNPNNAGKVQRAGRNLVMRGFFSSNCIMIFLIWDSVTCTNSI